MVCFALMAPPAALWLSARPRLPATSPLKAARALPIAAVVSTGGLPDLAYESARGEEGCGAAVIARLVGFSQPGRADVYADTSPAELGVGRDREVVINGEEEGISPPRNGAAYVAKMAANGADIRHVVLNDTGHVEPIAPGTAAWTRTVEAIEQLVR
ncbi:MAG TPA: hypothetical protein VMT68_06110 [Caulobacteraceae bacterium]|nr:hypothetical protein [Caulobacteraceae bacterium]